MDVPSVRKAKSESPKTLSMDRGSFRASFLDNRHNAVVDGHVRPEGPASFRKHYGAVVWRLAGRCRVSRVLIAESVGTSRHPVAHVEYGAGGLYSGPLGGYPALYFPLDISCDSCLSFLAGFRTAINDRYGTRAMKSSNPPPPDATWQGHRDKRE